MSREAMKLALEALESDPISHAGLVIRKQAITILRQALETDLARVGEIGVWLTPEEMERFAALVAKHEREACAKVAEEPYEFTSEESHRIAAAIRARGNT